MKAGYRFKKVKMECNKHIALIAHDNKKDNLLGWVMENKDKLSKHFLYGTGTTATLISEKLVYL